MASGDGAVSLNALCRCPFPAWWKPAPRKVTFPGVSALRNLNSNEWIKNGFSEQSWWETFWLRNEALPGFAKSVQTGSLLLPQGLGPDLPSFPTNADWQWVSLLLQRLQDLGQRMHILECHLHQRVTLWILHIYAVEEEKPHPQGSCWVWAGGLGLALWDWDPWVRDTFSGAAWMFCVMMAKLVT